MAVHLALTLLPPFGPEPSLIRRNRQCGPQFQHSVAALDDFHLCAWFVEVQPATNLDRQRHDSSGLNSYVPTESHNSIVARMQYYCNAE